MNRPPSDLPCALAPDKNAYLITAPDGAVVRAVRVTRVLEVLAKPLLLNWIAKQNRDDVIEVSADVYETVCRSTPMTRQGWINTLTNRVGDSRKDKRLLEKAGNIGTTVHKAVEWHLHKEMGMPPGPKPDMSDPDVQDAFNSWLNWRTTVDLTPGYLEKRVYSLKAGFAGTMDLYGYVDGKVAVVDWKTGKAVYPEARLQNAAYRYACIEMGLDPPEIGVIVRLPKAKGDGFEVVTISKEEADHHYNLFLKAKDLWEYLEAMNGSKP